MDLNGEQTWSLAICFFSRFCGVDKQEEFHEDVVPRPKIDETDFLLFQIACMCDANIFELFFSTAVASRPNLISITGVIVMISGIAFNRPDRPSRLRAFPYDRLKIYTIVPIIRIELNSIQGIEVVSAVRVVCDRVAFPYDIFDRLNFNWDDRDDPDDHGEAKVYRHSLR